MKTATLLKSLLSKSAGPQVAGVLSSLPGDYLARIKAASPDLVELRLDQMGPTEDWLASGIRIEQESIPVLGTLRLRSEGGAWNGPDEERLPLIRQALSAFSAIDIELASPLAEILAPVARDLGKALLLSHHNFTKTESLAFLQEVVAHARLLGGIPKVATIVNSPTDVETLTELLRTSSGQPLCVIAMGALAGNLRVEFPVLGSCIAYGYLDRPSAPGQPSAAELITSIASRIPAYREHRAIRKVPDVSG